MERLTEEGFGWGILSNRFCSCCLSEWNSLEQVLNDRCNCVSWTLRVLEVSTSEYNIT